MKTDGVNQFPDFHVRDGSSVYWQVKHILVRDILRVNIVEGRSKPVLPFYAISFVIVELVSELCTYLNNN